MQKQIGKQSTVEYYHNLADLATSGNMDKVSSHLNSKLRSRMLSFLPKSLEIWNRSMANFANVENIIKSPYKLNEDKKAYAIDSIAISNSLGLHTERLDFAYEAFSIYYLTVHFLDDLMEDPNKFHSKFIFSGSKEGRERRIRASGAAFLYESNLTIHNILASNGTSSDLLRVETLAQESLAKMIQYFRVKNRVLTPEKIIEIKNRKVSGESTKFFLNFAELAMEEKERFSQPIKDAMMFLGSLTQFTDDLRDLEEDRRDKNINLFIALKGLHRKDAAHEWAKLYSAEEQNMVKTIEESKIKTDVELLKIIPWYPFFAKKQIMRLARK